MPHASAALSPARTIASPHAITVAASFGFALVQLDVTIINVALPHIADVLSADVGALSWLVDAYALALAALMLSFGLLADRVGARRVYLGGLWSFAAASLLCGLAPSVGALIAGRTLQGVAGAAMLPSSLALLNHATSHDPALRARAIGLWTAAGSITIAAGPIVGGMLLALSGFRAIFLVNLPLSALGAYLTMRAAPSASAKTRGQLDLPGQLLTIVVLASFTATIIEARALGPTHPLVLTGFGMALLAAATFVRVESVVPAPMLSLQLLRVPSFPPAVWFGMTVNFTYYGVVFVLSLYLQRVKGYTAFESGLAYLPLTATFFGANVLSGWLVGRFGSRGPMVAGALVDACGFALLSRLTASSSYWQMFPAFTLIPLGMGLGVPAMTTAVLASVDRSSSGRAGAALNAARQAAGAVGVAVFGALCGAHGERVVAGLKEGARLAVIALLVASAVAYTRIDRGKVA